MKAKTLTKIDPAILKPKPLGVSQHAAGHRKRVTTSVNPLRPPLAIPLPEPANFNADPSNFAEGPLDDDDSDLEDVLKEFYASQVRSFCSLGRKGVHPSARIIRYSNGGLTAECTSMSPSGSKVKGSSLKAKADANSAAMMVSTAVSIVSVSTSFAEAA